MPSLLPPSHPGLDTGIAVIQSLRDDLGAVVERYEGHGSSIQITMGVPCDRRSILFDLARAQVGRNLAFLTAGRALSTKATAHARRVRVLLDSLEESGKRRRRVL